MTERILTYDRSIVPQETFYWCGPASTQVVLSARGINIAETELARQIGTTTNGTDYVGLITPVLRAHLGQGYVNRYIGNDPATAAQKTQLWADVVASINAGYGVIANIVAPPNNYPRGVKGSISPSYSGGTVYHYVAIMGYDDEARAVWVADSGFKPYGYWCSFDQMATLIPPKGYAAAPGEPPIQENVPIPESGMTAVTFSTAMGGSLPLDRYRALLPAFTDALRQADCTTVDRVAMLCAQVGHESSGLRYMEEIADGSQYEGRADLGHTQPGDGRRFKGHGPIQITGRFNHTQVSKWAHAEGLVPTPRYFVDNPSELGSDRYGFLGVVWYWTVARNMNAYADRGDIVGATRAVNGGTNGLDDRTRRWNICRALGAAILPTEGDDELMGIKFTNDDGHEVDAATALYFIDKHLGLILDQLGGPGTKSGADWPGWPVLGGDTVVEFLGKLNGRLTAIEAKLAKL